MNKKDIQIDDGLKPSSIFMPFVTCSKCRNFAHYFVQDDQYKENLIWFGDKKGYTLPSCCIRVT